MFLCIGRQELSGLLPFGGYIGEFKLSYMEKTVCRFRPPQSGRLAIWELTNHCNLACLHCCTNSSPQVSRKDDASGEDIKRALKEVDEANITEIYFTGGEPFVRRDFVDILTTACDTSATIFVATNGTLLTESDITRMQTLGIEAITISLDGHTAKLHNGIRQHPSAFEKAIRGIRLSVEAGLPIRVSHMITPDNVSMVEDFCHFIASLGVNSLALNSIIQAGRATEHEQDIVLDRSHEFNLVQTIGKMKDYYSGKMKIDHGISEEYSLAPVGCPAGDRLLHISGNGDVSVCSWLYKLDKAKYSIGNIKGEKLSEVLRNPRQCLQGLAQLDSTCPIPEVLELVNIGSQVHC